MAKLKKRPNGGVIHLSGYWGVSSSSAVECYIPFDLAVSRLAFVASYPVNNPATTGGFVNIAAVSKFSGTPLYGNTGIQTVNDQCLGIAFFYTYIMTANPNFSPMDAHKEFIFPNPVACERGTKLYLWGYASSNNLLTVEAFLNYSPI